MSLDLFDFLYRAIEPERFLDIVIYAFIYIILAVIPLISFGVSFKLIKRNWPNIFKSFGILIIPTIMYGVILYTIIPWTQRFPDDKIGVLLPRLPGSQLSEHFGDQQFNEALKTELEAALQDISIEFQLPQLYKMVEFKPISWVAGDEKEAKKLKSKYNAAVVYWGRITKLKDEAELTLTAQFAHFEFIVNIPNSDRLEFHFTDYSGSYYEIKLSESNRSLYKFSRIFIKRLLFTIASKMRYKDKLFFIDIVEKLPSIDSGYKDYDETPFILLSAAAAFEEMDSLEKAMEYYRLSANFLASYKDRIENDETILTITEKEIRRFGAFAKAKEASIALGLDDKERAEACYKQAISIPDKAMQEIIKNDDVFREFNKKR